MGLPTGGHMDANHKLSTPSTLALGDIDRITDGRIGTIDAPCPLCGPHKSAKGQRRKVLRVWRLDENFAGYRCVRCLAEGYARRNGGGRRSEVQQQRLAELKAAAEAHDAEYRQHQSEKAAWLWGKAIRPQGTVVQSYMANRGITFPLPRTIRYLPASDGYPPQMICAFGLFFEDADGKIAEPTKVTAIHRTL